MFPERAPAAGTVRIPLPSQADEALSLPDPTLLLGGDLTDANNRVPGPVDDREVVRVSLAPDGSPSRVVVDQTLSIKGTGDFRFSIQGPATDVAAPGDQRVQPGLRKGRVIWQGFSDRSEVLRSSITLDMAFERVRLPLSASVRLTRNGKPLRPPVDGRVDVEIAIANATTRSVPVTLGVPDRPELAALLESLRASLHAGRRPGDGVPASVPGTVVDPASGEDVPVPFQVDGSLSFGRGTLDLTRAAGASASGAGFRFAGRSPGAGGAPLVVRLTGTAHVLSAPTLSFRASPVLPDARALDLPGGQRWAAFLAAANEDQLRSALRLADTVLWQSLRIQEYDTHLGSPRRASGRTQFLSASAPEVAAPAPAAPVRVRPLGVVLALIALAGVVANATAIWSRL
jgi:hypothetical protein